MFCLILALALSACAEGALVRVPAGVTAIEEEAFANDASIASVEFPPGLTAIGARAFAGCGALTEIVLPPGTTTLGDGAFSNCPALRAVDVPGSVTSVGAGAFSGCDGVLLTITQGSPVRAWCQQNGVNACVCHPEDADSYAIYGFAGPNRAVDLTLPARHEGKPVTYIAGSAFYGKAITGVTIPEGVDAIGASAFAGCASLARVSLPAGLTAIDDGAFQRCSSLRGVALPATLETIGENAFDGVAEDFIATVAADSYAQQYCEENGIPCEIGALDEPADRFQYAPRGDGTVEITGYEGETADLVIPASLDGLPVSAIGSGAFFNCICLARVTVPEGVTEIASDAFAWCHALEEAALPDTLQSIGEGAFEQCFSLTRIALPAGVTDIGRLAFAGCSALEEIALPDALRTVGEGAFESCGALVRVALPEGVTALGEGAFRWCGNLRSAVLPASLTSIGAEAFEYAAEGFAATVPAGSYAMRWCDENGVACRTVGECADAESDYTWTALPGGAAITGWHGSSPRAFVPARVGGLPVTAVSDDAFAGSASLAGASLPAGVTEIGERAFRNCAVLRTIGLPEGLTSIGARAFEGCAALGEVRLPASLNSIAADAFAGCPGAAFTVTAGSYAEAWCAENGFACEAYSPEACFTWTARADGGVEITGYTGDSGIVAVPKVIAGREVASIGDGAFRYRASLTEVRLPAGLTGVGAEAFSGCASLREAALPRTLRAIGDRAFSGCASLSGIAIPGRVAAIGEDAFTGTAPDFTARVETGSFAEAWCLERGVNCESVAPCEDDFLALRCEDGAWTISGYTGSTAALTIPAEVNGHAVAGIDPSAFCGCDFLTSVAVSEGIATIGRGAFSGCENLAEVSLPDSLTSIGRGAFEDCALTTVTIPAGVTDIPGNPFEGCRNLTAIAVSEGNASFAAPGGGLVETSTGRLVSWPAGQEGSACAVPDGVRIVGTGAFARSGFAQIALPDGVTGIEPEAFSNCPDLTEITLGAGLETIGESAFAYCVSLTGVELPENLRVIGAYAFAGCFALEGVQTGSRLEELGESAFEDCGALLGITLPDSLCRAGKDAFAGCPNLTVTVHAGSWAEQYCRAQGLTFSVVE